MRPPAGLPSLSRRSRILLVVAVVVAALLLVGPRLIGMYTDWLWFGEVGFRGVFTKVLLTRFVLFLVVGIVVGAIVWLAMLLAYRARPVFVPVSGPNDPIARYRTTVMSRLRLFGVIIPVAIGILSGLIAQANWVTIQLFLNGQAFGITDPQFNMDVSFYTFDLPFYRFVLNWFVRLDPAGFRGKSDHPLRFRWNQIGRTSGDVHYRRSCAVGCSGRHFRAVEGRRLLARSLLVAFERP